MAWDLALDGNGDVIMSGSHDLLGRSGTDLIEQRMRLRMKLHRGEWFYDNSDTLGSQLYRLLGMSPDRAMLMLPAYVREALSPIEGISIDDIQTKTTDSGEISVVVIYHTEDDLEAYGDAQANQAVITFPLTGGSS